MQLKSVSFITILAITTFLTGCGGSEANTNTTNSTNLSNGNSAIANGGNTSPHGNLDPATKPAGEKINDAPTLQPVVQAYYDAIENKDDAAIRKVLTASFIKVLEADMKEEKKTNLAAFIAETDRVPEGGIQVRNEKITGDEGTAEIKGGVYLNWTALGFAKEGGVWKFSNKIPDVQAVDKSKGK